MLELDQVTKSYHLPGNRQLQVLNIARLSVDAGEKAAIVGPSGSGKSTLLHVIAGIVRPTSGSIRFQDLKLEALSESQLDGFRAAHIGYVFQNFNLIPGYSALENVLVAMRFGGVIPGKERRRRAEQLLAEVGLQHRLHHTSSQLSNGEQQRVYIARALANRPSLVLADEPTASLDPGNAELVFTLLAEVCGKSGAALLMCTHDLELADRLERKINIRDISAADSKEVV